MKINCNDSSACADSPLSVFSSEAKDVRSKQCEDAIRCATPSPTGNFTSEAPDRHAYFARTYVGPGGPQLSPIPLGGVTRIPGGCTQLGSSLLGFWDAQQCTDRAASACSNGSEAGSECDSTPADPDPDPVPPPGGSGQPATKMYGNSPQTCTINCPDGATFGYTVNAGVYVAQSQDLANQMAYSAACRGAYQNLICLQELSQSVCAGEHVSIALSGFVNNGSPHYSIVDGSLPTGMSLSEDGVITGETFTAGSSTFKVRLCDDAGNCTEKVMHIGVMAISPDALPSASYGAAYNSSVSASGGTAPYSFSASGLPSGLTMSSAGAITGTPSSCGPFTLHVTAVDSTGMSCSKFVSLNVAGASNDAITSVKCPSNPSIVIPVDVPAGKYCGTIGYSKAILTSLAQADAIAQMNANPGACACRITSVSADTVGKSQVFNTNCLITLYCLRDSGSQWTAPMGVINANGPVDYYNSYWGAIGSPPAGVVHFCTTNSLASEIFSLSFH